MKEFLKDKPKEDFPKAPNMPEDMKEMYKQRQRELQLERAQMAVDEDDEKTTDTITTPSTVTEPRLEDKTLPPAPKSDSTEPRTPPDPTKKPAVPAATPAESRPREVDPNKKKG
jgi:hypothetical protein